MHFGDENFANDIQRVDGILCGTNTGEDMSGVIALGPFGPNLEAFATMQSVPLFAFSTCGVILANGNAPGAVGYMALIKNGFVKLVTSEYTLIKSVPMAIPNGSRVGISNRGQALTVWIDTGDGFAPVITAVDFTYEITDSWYIGVYTSFERAPDGVEFKNFGGGTYTGPMNTGSLGLAVYDQLPQWHDLDAANQFALLIYIGGLGQMLQDLDYLVHSDNGDPPWSVLFDLDRVPDTFLPWLGQFAGVPVNTALTADGQRQQIRSHTGWGRGTPEALKAAIRPFLSGTQSIILDEQDTSAYHQTFSTYEDEEPADLTAMLAAAQAAKVGSLVMAHVTIPGSPADGTYEDWYDTFATYDTLMEDFETYKDIHI